MIIKRLVSIVIVNWNHGAFLTDCLNALEKQTYSPIEILVIDNASSDGSPQSIVKDFPNVKLTTFKENFGFSKAFNYGVKVTQSEFILSLNPDVVTTPEFLGKLVEIMDLNEKVGITAPKLMRANDPSLIDSTGLFLNRLRKPFDRGQNEVDNHQYDEQTEIFGACGAAALYRREMIEKVSINGEFLDEDFFAYYEDVDVSWRAKKLGWRCVYAPSAIASHVRGWGDTLHKQGDQKFRSIGPRLALRNRYLMIIKNEQFRDIWLTLVLILIVDTLKNVYLLTFYPRVLLGVYRSFSLIAECNKEKTKNQ